MRAAVMTLAAMAAIVGVIGALEYKIEWLWLTAGGLFVLALADWALPGSGEE